MAEPDVSVVIVNWNTRELLLACLAALPHALGGLLAEVWVVDNGSSDGSVEAVEEHFPKAKLIANSQNRGFAAANNQAIAASRGRHILLLNSDTIPLAGSLETLVHFSDRHPGVGIVGACLLNGDGTLQRSWAEFPTLRSELVGKNFRTRAPFLPEQALEAYSVDWVGGACLLIRRAAAEQVGPMDEQFFMYSEEADWCYRTKRAGWKICYLPPAQVVHLGGQSSRMVSARMKAELYRSKLLFFAKHYGRISARLLGLLLQAGFLSKAVVRRLRGAESAGHADEPDSLLLVRVISQALAPGARGRAQANSGEQ